MNVAQRKRDVCLRPYSETLIDIIKKEKPEQFEQKDYKTDSLYENKQIPWEKILYSQSIPKYFTNYQKGPDDDDKDDDYDDWDEDEDDDRIIIWTPEHGWDPFEEPM
ncbi:MAG: hypothetical protein KKA79_05640 [Nanoarchaeota archaeon]|nr:hypothetical protein [Nanoarchaeota archaeon]